MLSRCIKQAASEVQWHTLSLPPTFLLPLRARLSTTPSSVDLHPPPEPFHLPRVQHKTTAGKLQTSTLPAAPETQYEPPTRPTNPTAVLSPSVRDLLPLLRAQPSHYITAHIHARPYLLTLGDTLRLPFHMPKVKPGDVLRLNRASSIGSRDYTMRGAPYLDERLFECRATVVGVEAEPMRFIEKTKRRNRKVKTVKSKHRFTLLKVKELKIKSLEEVEGEDVVGRSDEVLGSESNV